MLRFKVSLLVLGLVLSLQLEAQTLHAIVFCNTSDRSIGSSMQVEYANVRKQVQTLAELLDYDEDFYFMDGATCTRANLKKTVDQMDVDPDDVILTFYGGHGSHAPNNESDPWPQYLMNSGFENQGNWVPMAALANWVKAKKPRLAVILSNCCNVVQGATTIKPLWAMGGDYTRLDGIRAERFKKLFSSKGVVMATSSKIPEPSWCNASEGGLFTCDLLEAFKMVGTGAIDADWNVLLKKAYDLCVKRDIVDREGTHYRQHPYYEVNGTPNGGGNGGKTIDRDRREPRKFNDPLREVLAKLVDKSVDENTRLRMIPSINREYFVGNYDKVLTVAKDLKTGIDYEDPEAFLRRICLSPFIEQVDIISTNNKTLIVHEERNQ